MGNRVMLNYNTYCIQTLPRSGYGFASATRQLSYGWKTLSVQQTRKNQQLSNAAKNAFWRYATVVLDGGEAALPAPSALPDEKAPSATLSGLPAPIELTSATLSVSREVLMAQILPVVLALAYPIRVGWLGLCVPTRSRKST